MQQVESLLVDKDAKIGHVETDLLFPSSLHFVLHPVHPNPIPNPTKKYVRFQL